MAPPRESITSSSRSPQTNPLPPLGFPANHHLLITTRRNVFSLSPTGLRKLYSSHAGAIVAATELRDEVLAIADGKVVRFCKKGETKRRYKLRGGDGLLAVLKPVKEGRELLFTSSLHNGVMAYSLPQERVCDLGFLHPSTPSTLAVSVKSIYMVSASSQPPVIYVRLLKSTAKPTQIIPHASQAPVTVISFHPEREEIFLLGYQDGTVSIHTASRILLMRDTSSDGGIAHLKRAHRTTNSRLRRYPTNFGMRTRRFQQSSSDLSNVGAASISITAAAFMGGYKARVITVGGDGKCRMIDFGRGASLLRTWHVSAPCTSLAIYSPPSLSQENQSTTIDTMLSDPTVNLPSGHIIAIGRNDGFVSLFDNLGLLREDRLISTSRKAIVELDWVSHFYAKRAAEHTPSAAEESSLADIQWKFTDPINNAKSSSLSVGTPSSRVKVDALELQNAKSTIYISPAETAFQVPPSTPKKQIIPANLDAVVTPTRSPKTSTPNSKSPRLLDSLRRTPFTPSPRSPTSAKGDAVRRVATDSIQRSLTETEIVPSKDRENCSSKDFDNSETLPNPLEMTMQLTSSSVYSNHPRMPCSWDSPNSIATSGGMRVRRPSGSFCKPLEVHSSISSNPSEDTTAQKSSTDSSDQTQFYPKTSIQFLIRMKDDEETPPVKLTSRLTMLTQVSLAQSDGWETDSRASTSPDKFFSYNISPDNEPSFPKDRQVKLGNISRHRNVATSPRSSTSPNTISNESSTIAKQEPLFRAPPSSARTVLRRTDESVRTERKPSSLSAYSMPPRTSPSRIPLRLVRSPPITPSRVPLPLSPAYYKRLPSLPVSEDVTSHNCDCADLIRTEMGLVRAEVASLRKSIWVFGSRVERGMGNDELTGRDVFDLAARQEGTSPKL